MKIAHNIKISVFRKDEDREPVIAGLKSLFPFDLETEKVTINSTEAEGLNENKIEILEVVLKKERLVNLFMKKLLEKLGEQKKILVSQIDSRLDFEQRFFLRLDKEKAIKNEFVLTDSGNCYHIAISVAAFPKTKESARKVIAEFLQS